MLRSFFICVSVTQLVGGESVRFSQERYLVEVDEGSPPGTLLVVQASTPDAGNKNNEMLSKFITTMFSASYNLFNITIFIC